MIFLNFNIDFIHSIVYIFKYWYLYAFGEDDEIPNYYYAGEISSQLQSDLFIFSILGSLIQVFSVPTSLLYILPLTIFEGVMLQSKHLLF